MTDNFRRRGVIIIDCCCMCKKSGETVDHLLLHCDVVRALWIEVFSILELAWVMPTTVEALLACWTNLRGIPQIKAVWKMVLICILWCLTAYGRSEMTRQGEIF